MALFFFFWAHFGKKRRTWSVRGRPWYWSVDLIGGLVYARGGGVLPSAVRACVPCIVDRRHEGCYCYCRAILFCW